MKCHYTAECFGAPLKKFKVMILCRDAVSGQWNRSCNSRSPGCVCVSLQGAEKPLLIPKIDSTCGGSKVSPEATPEGKEKNGAVLLNHEEQSLPTNSGSEEEEASD